MISIRSLILSGVLWTTTTLLAISSQDNVIIQDTCRVIVGTGRLSPKSMRLLHSHPTLATPNDVTIDINRRAQPDICSSWSQNLSTHSLLIPNHFDEVYIAHVLYRFPIEHPMVPLLERSHHNQIFQVLNYCLDPKERTTLTPEEIRKWDQLAQTFAGHLVKADIMASKEYQELAKNIVHKTFSYLNWVHSCLKPSGIFRFHSYNPLIPYPVKTSEFYNSLGFPLDYPYKPLEYLEDTVRYYHGFISEEKILIYPDRLTGMPYFHQDVLEPAKQAIDIEQIQNIYYFILTEMGFKPQYIHFIEEQDRGKGYVTFEIIAEKEDKKE
ncbi:MAG TPA: hypothetical protein VNJ29_02825 [Candidatus Nitrosotenuis sp.]|jgi:hypothetical protein|nr:hypothetical protein [Candidatus Nitrosotenuis sp.]